MEDAASFESAGTPSLVVRVLATVAMFVVLLFFEGVVDHFVLSYTWVQVAAAALGLIMFAVLLPYYVRRLYSR